MCFKYIFVRGENWFIWGCFGFKKNKEIYVKDLDFFI